MDDTYRHLSQQMGALFISDTDTLFDKHTNDECTKWLIRSSFEDLESRARLA